MVRVVEIGPRVAFVVEKEFLESTRDVRVRVGNNWD